MQNLDFIYPFVMSGTNAQNRMYTIFKWKYSFSIVYHKLNLIFKFVLGNIWPRKSPTGCQDGVCFFINLFCLKFDGYSLIYSLQFVVVKYLSLLWHSTTQPPITGFRGITSLQAGVYLGWTHWGLGGTCLQARDITFIFKSSCKKFSSKLNHPCLENKGDNTIWSWLRKYSSWDITNVSGLKFWATYPLKINVTFCVAMFNLFKIIVWHCNSNHYCPVVWLLWSTTV